MIDSVYRTGENYYPQVLLEKCRFVIKESKMSEYITDIDNRDEEHSDEINPDGEISDEENKTLMERINYKCISFLCI